MDERYNQYWEVASQQWQSDEDEQAGRPWGAANETEGASDQPLMNSPGHTLARRERARAREVYPYAPARRVESDDTDADGGIPFISHAVDRQTPAEDPVDALNRLVSNSASAHPEAEYRPPMSKGQRAFIAIFAIAAVSCVAKPGYGKAQELINAHQTSATGTAAHGHHAAAHTPNTTGKDGLSSSTRAPAAPGHKASNAPPTIDRPPIPKKGGNQNIRVMTWNLLGKPHTDPGGKDQKRPEYNTRIHLAEKIIRAENPDAAGFQEVEGAQFPMLKAALRDTYTLVPNKPAANHLSENVLAVRSSRFTVLKSGYTKIWYFHTHHARVPWALLRDKVTGKKIYDTNTHDPADTRQFHPEALPRFHNARVHLRTGTKWIRRGVAVINTGDFNSSKYLRQGKDNPLHGNTTKLTPNVMASTGLMRSAADSVHGMPARLRTFSHKQIDWIFTSKDLVATGWKQIRSRTAFKASDHYPIVADMHFVGSSDSKTRPKLTAAVLPKHESVWLAATSRAMLGAKTYLKTRLVQAVKKPAINLDIDNTALATHYNSGQPVPAVLEVAKYAALHHVALLFNTGRTATQLGNTPAALKDAGYDYAALCTRKEGLSLPAGKIACRRVFAQKGYTVIANIGNNPTDFAGSDYGRAFELPNYNGKLK